jgi:hypothetical protein
MKQTTQDLMEQTRKELFESEEFAVVRKILTWTPSDTTGTRESLDTLFDKVEHYKNQ